jgi:hypothetical protein
VQEIVQTKLGERLRNFSRVPPAQGENPAGDSLFLTLKVTVLLKTQAQNEKTAVSKGNGRSNKNL